MTTSLTFARKADCELTGPERRGLQKLLQNCFPGYFMDRLYHKQVPQYRWLAKDNGCIIGQVGVDYRVIHSKRHGPLSILGIIDTCVDAEYRDQGIASRLLQHLEHWAEGKAVDALIVFADDHRLYEKLGYCVADVTSRFLAIEEHESVKVMEKEMGAIFMVKFAKHTLDLEGDYIDMLGYVF